MTNLADTAKKATTKVNEDQSSLGRPDSNARRPVSKSCLLFLPWRTVALGET